MTIRTKKFSEFIDAGDLEPNEITVGLNTGTNAQFNNPFPLLPPGTTAERPTIAANMFYRLRFNTTLQSYEYYDPITMAWVQLEDSGDLPDIPAVIYTAYAPLSSAFDLGTLNSGILKQTVAAGVSTPAIAVNGLDYYGPDYSGYYRDPAGIEDTDSNPIVDFNTAGVSSVNYMQISNNLTTANPTLTALGSDVNVGIDFTAKEAGVFNFSTTESSAAFNFKTGTANQHVSQFTFANTAATRTITWQDSDGTVAYLGDLNNYVQSVTGTANEIDVDNTDAQNPILSLSSTLDAPGTFTIQGTVALDAIIDDDTMATATDTNVPTAESVVAYVAATPGGAGGSNTEIQYNNGGVLDGDSGFTTNGAGSVAIVGDLTVDNLNLNGNTLSSATATDVILAPASGQALDVNLIGGGGVTYDFTGAGDFVVTMGSGSFQVDNLDISGNTISSTNTAGDINLTPNTTGNLVLDGVNWPQADGAAGTLLTTDGVGQTSWTTAAFPSGSGTLNHLLRSDGTNWVETTATTLDASDIMSGLTQLNVDNLRLDGNTISSTDTAGNIVLTPDTTGNIVLDGLNWPQADGTANQALITNGAAQLSFADVPIVTVPTVDQTIARFDGTGGALEDSGITIDDSNVMSGVTQLNVDNLRLDGNTLSSTDTNGDINLTPDGTGVTNTTSLNVTGSVVPQTGIYEISDQLRFATNSTLRGYFNSTGQFQSGTQFAAGCQIAAINPSPPVKLGVGCSTNISGGGLGLVTMTGSGSNITSSWTSNGFAANENATALTLQNSNYGAVGWIFRAGSGTSASNRAVLSMTTAAGVNTTPLIISADGSLSANVGTTGRFRINTDGQVVAGSASTPLNAINDLSAYVGNQGLVTVAASGNVNTAGGFNSILTTRTGNGNVPAGGVGGNIYPTNSTANSWTQINSSYDGWLWQWRCGNLANQSSSSMKLIYQDTLGTPITAISVDYLGEVTFSSPLPVGSGGTGITTTPSNGQIPIGNGTNYTASTLTAGTGVSIANGAGSITISASGSGLSWSTDATGTIAAAVDNGYICGAAGATTLTLPATAAVGAAVLVEGLGAGGWVLTANTGQTIQIGSGVTSSGGTLTSAAATDNVTVICIVANTTWRVQTTNSAGLTIA